MIHQEEMSKLFQTAKSKYLEAQKAREESSQLSEYKDAQSLIEIDDIIDGLIFTSDGRIVSILEILPINYYEKEDATKDRIATNFGFAFKQLPDDGQFKVMYINTNLDQFERRIRLEMKDETNPRLKERVDDYIEHVRFMQKKNSMCRRFFFISEYQGDDNKRVTNEYQEIYAMMMQNVRDTIIAFSEMGNAVVNLCDDSKDVCEILYQYFNPKTAQSESLSQRIDKVISSASHFNQTPTLRDFIAPRGIQFGKWDYVAYDGYCHNYLVLRENAYPTEVVAGWLNNIISSMDNGDLDIYYHKANSSFNDFLIDRVDVLSQSISYRHNDSEVDKQQELSFKSQNARHLKECIKNGEDYYEVCIIVTLRANTARELNIKTTSFIRKMKTSGYLFDKCTLNVVNFFKMAVPIHKVDNGIFKSHRRNFTNSSLSTLYCFSSYELFDRNGLCLGCLNNNGTLFAIDPFSKIYPNPHIFIAGTTGAGKSYTEHNILSRMRMLGVRTMCILPLKGHEYEDNINSLGGSYIKIGPGEKNCINICEIRPSDKINPASYTDDSDMSEELKHVSSFLSQKTTLLVNWARMLLDDKDSLSREEAGELNAAFTKVYNRFGITDDNMSVFDENGVIKKMPIIGDLYEEIRTIPMLSRVASAMKPWVWGNCQNMNGPTNIDLTNKVMAFDVNEEIIGEELLPAFMLICFDICYGIAQRDLAEKCCIVLDETWKFLMIPECAKYIFKMIKILRAYNTCLITATQDIEDCMQFPYGRVLLTLSATIIYLRMNKKEIEAIERTVSFSEQNKETLKVLPSGIGFYSANEDRVLVNFELSDLELEIYEPNPKKKAELHAKRMAKLANKVITD